VEGVGGGWRHGDVVQVGRDLRPGTERHRDGEETTGLGVDGA